MPLEESVNNLKRLTRELAEEVHDRRHGWAFDYVRLLFDNVESYVTIVDEACNFAYFNPAMAKATQDMLNIAIHPGDHCLKLLKDNDAMCSDCIVKACISQRKVLNQIITSPNTGIKYWRTCIPLAYNGVSGVIEILERYHES